jgi:hypothetical protein
MSESPRHHDGTSGDERPADALVAAVVSYDDAPDECTIYPADADDDDLVTRWITAQAGSFVPLAETR